MNPSIASLVLFCAAVAGAPLAASAAPITVPTGLNPGDTYRLAFLTSKLRDATSTNIADYNAFVTGVANAVPELATLGTTWKVIGSTALVDARENTGTSPLIGGAPIYRLDGAQIAASNADLWDGSINVPIIVSENGGHINREFVATGMYEWGAGYPGLELGTANPVLGRLGTTNYTWAVALVGDSTAPVNFYAISGVLTVVPEPSSLLLVCSGVTAVLGCQFGGRCRRKRQWHVVAGHPSPSFATAATYWPMRSQWAPFS
jgi:hypothetical protein